jgi:hypothetical protein
MNIWLIAAVIAGLFIIGSFVVGNFVSADSEQQNSESFSCSTCGNSCTAENNCGLATCGAVSGSGSCGCGR